MPGPSVALLAWGARPPPRRDRMDRIIALTAATLAGAVIATQAPTNGALGRSIGDLRAVVVNFAVGGIAIAVIALLVGGGRGGLGGLGGDPVRWHYLGGL